MVPLPCVAAVTVSGFLCRYSMSSETLDTGSFLELMMSALGTWAITTIGSKRVGSNPSFG